MSKARARCARAIGVLAVAGMLAAALAGPAAAIDPPDIDSIPVTTPQDPDPKPPVPMKQGTACATSATLKDSVWTQPPPANVAFDVDRLHEFATGKGVTVAIIDSGVTPNVRLPRLRGGGDFIANSNGLEDCDHHGTLVAGIIGATASPDDQFVGVAPEASLISIRQTSSAYEPVNNSGGDQAASSSTLSTLAQAIVRAVNMGAKVVNLSVTACFPAGRIVDTADLAQALRYAVERKDAVIVASAGNSSGDSCKPNPGWDPDNAGDPDNWAGVRTVSMPSYYSPLVLSVGGATLTGQPYGGSMPGPWVGVAAPATEIVSLDPTKKYGGLTNATVGKDGPQPIAGTSFASAYVAGLAALIRQRDPDLTAAQVRERIVASAHTPALSQRGTFGSGLVDAYGALTWTDHSPRSDVLSRPMNRTAARPDRGWVGAVVAASGVGAAMLAMVLGVGMAGMTQKRRQAQTRTKGGAQR